MLMSQQLLDETPPQGIALGIAAGFADRVGFELNYP